MTYIIFLIVRYILKHNISFVSTSAYFCILAAVDVALYSILSTSEFLCDSTSVILLWSFYYDVFTKMVPGTMQAVIQQQQQQYYLAVVEWQLLTSLHTSRHVLYTLLSLFWLNCVIALNSSYVSYFLPTCVSLWLHNFQCGTILCLLHLQMRILQAYSQKNSAFSGTKFAFLYILSRCVTIITKITYYILVQHTDHQTAPMIIIKQF